MALAKVIKSGSSQSVQLPKKFHINTSHVEIFRRDKELVLREKPSGMTGALDAFAALPDDLFREKRKAPPPQRRKR